MAKRWKYVRAALVQAGYTTTASASEIVLEKIELYAGEYWVFYTDENGDKVRSLYGKTSPITVDPTTDYITFVSPTYYLAGASAYTSAFRVNNDNGNDVTLDAHTTYTTPNALFATRSSNVLTAVGSGTTVLTATTNGTMTASTSIVVGEFNSTIVPSGGTILDASTGTIQLTSGTLYYFSTGLTVKNGISNVLLVNGVNSTLRYKQHSHALGAETLLTAPFTATGTTLKVIIYDKNAYEFNTNYSGATYAITTV